MYTQKKKSWTEVEIISEFQWDLGDGINWRSDLRMGPIELAVSAEQKEGRRVL